MKNPDIQIRNFLNTLTKHIVVLNARFNLYLYLLDCVEDKRNKIIYKESPSFFKNVFDCLFSDILISIHKLYDKSDRAERSMHSYLNIVIENINVLSINKNHLTLEDVNRQLSKIDSISHILKKVKTHRDRYRAHTDKKYFDDVSKLWEEAPIKNDELQEVFDVTLDIIKKHKLAINGSDTDLELTNWNDVRNIIKLINNYNKTLDNIEVQKLILEGKIPRKYDE